MIIKNSDNLKRASGFLVKRIATVLNRSDSPISDHDKIKVGRLIERSQSYIFFSDNVGPTFNSKEVIEKLNITILDLPSQTIHLEVGNGIIGRIGSKEDIQNNKFCLHSLIVHEKIPGDYEFLALVNDTLLYLFTNKDPQYNCLVHLTFELLKNLQKFKIGVQEVRESILIKTNKTKIRKNINQIIYVHPRSWNESTPELSGKKIDYSHRFIVRGHWRQCKFLGKDREGKYTVKGYTWVSEHIKGPDSKPLIANKIRLESNKECHGNILVAHA